MKDRVFPFVDRSLPLTRKAQSDFLGERLALLRFDQMLGPDGIAEALSGEHMELIDAIVNYRNNPNDTNLEKIKEEVGDGGVYWVTGMGLFGEEFLTNPTALRCMNDFVNIADDFGFDLDRVAERVIKTKNMDNYPWWALQIFPGETPDEAVSRMPYIRAGLRCLRNMDLLTEPEIRVNGYSLDPFRTTPQEAYEFLLAVVAHHGLK
jgi:hypothetical protein